MLRLDLNNELTTQDFEQKEFKIRRIRALRRVPRNTL